MPVFLNNFILKGDYVPGFTLEGKPQHVYRFFITGIKQKEESTLAPHIT